MPGSMPRDSKRQPPRLVTGRLTPLALATSLILLLCPSQSARAQPPPFAPQRIYLPLLGQAFTSPGRDSRLELVGQYGGNTYAVAGQGSRVYVGFGPRIYAYERQSRGGHALLGRSPLLTSTVRSIVADKDRLVAHLHDGRVLAFAVEADGSIGPAGVLSTEAGLQPHQILLAEHVVYILRVSGVYIVDLTTPNLPEPIAEIPQAVLGDCEPIRGIALHEGSLVSTCRHSLRVHDISEPSLPRQIGQLVIEASSGLPSISFGSPLLMGQLAVIPTSQVRQGWITLVDLSQPERPELLSEWHASFFHQLITAGSRVFAYLFGQSIQLLDFSDPAQPRILDSMSLSQSEFVGVSEGHLHFVSESLIESFTETDGAGPPTLVPGEPIDRIQCNGTRFWRGQCVAGEGHIFSYSSSRVCIHDASDPTMPRPLGCGALEVSDDWPLAAVSARGAWLLEGSNLIAISPSGDGEPLDISIRSLPPDELWLPRRMQLVDGFLMLVRSPSRDPGAPQRLEFFDVSTAISPAPMATIDFDAGPLSGPVEVGDQKWLKQGAQLGRLEFGGPDGAAFVPVTEISREGALISDGERLFVQQGMDGLTRLWPIDVSMRDQLRLGEPIDLRPALRSLTLSSGVAFGLSEGSHLLAFDLGQDAPGQFLGVLREPPYKLERSGPPWRGLLEARDGRLTITDMQGGVAFVQVLRSARASP